MKKVEECVKNCLNFRGNEYDEEDEFLLAMEELDLREKELDISYKEWKSVWMLQMTRKRKSVEMFQYQALRDIIKAGGDTVMKNFGDKFRQLKVEGSRKKTVQTLFMGTESRARRNFQDR